MGNLTSISNLDVAQPLGAEWVKESRQSYCAVLRNIQTGQQAEQYVVSTAGSIPAEFQRYDYRLHQNENLVSTWAVQHVGDDGVCNGSHKLLVTNERIPLRLSEVSGLNFQDSLTVIYSALVGFHAIHQVEGYVSVNDEMIGFTPDHRVKVWLNENFSENYPSLVRQRVVNPQYSASTMIEEIIAVVEEHSAEPLLPNFRNYFYSRFPTTGTFGSALAIVRDYVQASGLVVTNRMTFTAGAPRQVVSGEYQTSYVYPEVPAASKIEHVTTIAPGTTKSTLIQAGQPVVSHIAEPPMVSYIQQPAQVYIQEPVAQAPMSFIASSPIVQAPVITTLPEVITPAPASFIEQRIVSPTPFTTNKGLTRSMIHRRGPTINEGVVVRNPLSPVQTPTTIHTLNPRITSIQKPITATIDNINIQPVSLVTRDTVPVTTSPIVNSRTDIIPNSRIQKGNNLLEAERFLENLKKNQAARLSPQRGPPTPPKRMSGSPPKVETLFEKKVQTNVVQGQTQTQSVQKQQVQQTQQTQRIQVSPVVENPALGHRIGQTLKKYVAGGVQGVVQVSPIQSATKIPDPKSPTPPSPLKPTPTGLFPTSPTYIPPRVQTNDTRTINIDGIATARLEQSQQIFNLNEPRTPIQHLPDPPNRGVVEGLQNAIKQMGDISVTESNKKDTTVINTVVGQKKEYDLIEQMKTQLDANANIVEEKYMTHSFGENKEETSEHLLSQDVRDLLRNYDSSGAAYASGYAVNTEYKGSSYKVDDPIIIFNEDAYNRVESKGETIVNKYQTGSRYESVTFSKPSDDYQALKAKYDIKYDNKHQTPAFYSTTQDNYLSKYDDYKTEQKVQYNRNLGESKYLKDYTSDNYNQDDPLIVFNRKKSDLGGRDSLGYKVSVGGRGGDYDDYRRYLKGNAENERYEEKYGKYDTKYESGYENGRYGSRNEIQYEKSSAQYDRANKYDKYDRAQKQAYKADRYDRYQDTNRYPSARYDGGSSKYGNRQTRYQRNNQDRYEREPRYQQREERYQARYEQRTDRGRNARQDRENRADRYERRQENYERRAERGDGGRESIRQRRESRRQYKGGEKNISYNDLQSILYD